MKIRDFWSGLAYEAGVGGEFEGSRVDDDVLRLDGAAEGEALAVAVSA